MRFPNKAARQDYLLKKEVEVGGKEVEWGDIKDAPVGDISKGVEAYGWGDHSKAGYLKSIPKGVAVEDATSEEEVLTQLNALLNSLRGAGLIEG